MNLIKSILCFCIDCRNMFIIGFTLLTGLTVGNWIKENPGINQTKIPTLDQVFTVLLSSAVFIGGILGFFDSTVSGEPDNLLIFVLMFEIREVFYNCYFVKKKISFVLYTKVLRTNAALKYENRQL